MIVPVLDEADRVNALVDHIRTVGYGRDLEILVADGHVARTTLAALDRPGVTRVASGPGRARQMNAAAKLARGDALVFLHADTKLPVGAFQAMDAVLDRGLVGGAFDLDIASPRFPYPLIARIASLRSRLTGIPYGDQAIFLDAGVFQALNGYRDLPLLEDVDLLRRLRRAGLRIGFAQGRAVTSPRRYEAEGPWRVILKHQAIMALYLLGVSPERLAGLRRPFPRGRRP